MHKLPSCISKDPTCQATNTFRTQKQDRGRSRFKRVLIKVKEQAGKGWETGRDEEGSQRGRWGLGLVVVRGSVPGLIHRVLSKDEKTASIRLQVQISGRYRISGFQSMLT